METTALHTDDESEHAEREERAKDALRRLVAAAFDLNRAWGDGGNARMNRRLEKGYPACLPSFDEFLNDLMAWRDEVL